MHETAGVALIVASCGGSIVTALVLRTRAPAGIVAVVLAMCGVALATGGLFLLDRVSRTEWIVTVVLLAMLVPAHVRVVLGPFGPRPERS